GLIASPFVKLVLSSGKVGTTAQILGAGFNSTTKVKFNGTSATFTVVSDTYLTAKVPAGATTGAVTVTTSAGTLTSSTTFRVIPKVVSFSPTSGPVGTPVVIKGNSFTGATAVTFGGVKATTYTVDSDTQITATVPTGAKTGKIGVTTPGGTGTSSGVFTVT
ncbi:MAG: phospholipase, partial [Acidobacteriia bacterium]|nr:phospholipase [Terriglobia bacterium]